MADGKYGRLFTEADVRYLLRYAALRADNEGIDVLSRDADGNAVDPGELLLADYDEIAAELTSTQLTFPADEPLFLLRAKDRDAAAGLYGYAEGCDMDSDVGEEQRKAVAAAIRAFHEFEAAHPDRVKVPG